jgi:hypothetical protein
MSFGVTRLRITHECQMSWTKGSCVTETKTPSVKKQKQKIGKRWRKKTFMQISFETQIFDWAERKRKKEKRLLLIQSVLLDLCVYAKYWLHHFKWRNSLSSTSRFVLFFKWFIFWNQSLIENGFMCNTKPLHWHNISSLPLSTYYNYKCY